LKSQKISPVSLQRLLKLLFLLTRRGYPHYWSRFRFSQHDVGDALALRRCRPPRSPDRSGPLTLRDVSATLHAWAVMIPAESPARLLTEGTDHRWLALAAPGIDGRQLEVQGCDSTNCLAIKKIQLKQLLVHIFGAQKRTSESCYFTMPYNLVRAHSAPLMCNCNFQPRPHRLPR
jgi:hypothetical protein